jgi:hypothetical protein
LSKKTLIAEIESLEFESLTILQINKYLKNKYAIPEIQKTLSELKKRKGLWKVNDFGKCGIDPEVNPCGDADEY